MCKIAPKYISPFKVTNVFPESSNYELELSEELIAWRIHPKFHISLLRPFKPNDDVIFPSRESKRFYDFGMPDNDEWLVDEIVSHRFVGKSIEFNVRWTAGDHTWEPFTSVKELEALDHYFALMGVTHWQSLARKPTINVKEALPSHRIMRRKGSRH